MFVGKRVMRTLRGGSAVLPKRGDVHVIPKHESFFLRMLGWEEWLWENKGLRRQIL